MSLFNHDPAPQEFSWTLQWKNNLSNLISLLKSFLVNPEFSTVVVNDSLVVQGDVLVEGGLQVVEDLSTEDLLVEGEAEFGDDVAITGDLHVDGRVLTKVVNTTNKSSDYQLSINETAKISITAASTPLNIAVENGVYELILLFDDSTFGSDQDISLLANNTTYPGEFDRVSFIADTAIATDEVDTINNDPVHYELGNATRPKVIKATLIIDGLLSGFTSVCYGITSGSRRQRHNTLHRTGSVAHTSLGTISIGEVATGTCYVKRIA